MFFVVSILILFVVNTILVHSQSAILIANTYYPGQSTSAQVGDILCFQINECSGGMGGYTQAQLVIDLPQNPEWDLNKGFVVVEISKCVNSFEQSCILYTNYIWNNGLNIIVYSNITFSWAPSNGNSSLYIRFRGVQAPADFTFQFTYGQYGYVTYGEYDFAAFETSNGCASAPQVHQFAQPSAVVSVSNTDTVFYQLQFCPNNNFPVTNWSANVNLVASPEKPKSAFEMWACSANYGTNNCKSTYNNAENLSATAILNLQISDTQSAPLDNGIIIAIYGIGGETDFNNIGILSITVANT